MSTNRNPNVDDSTLDGQTTSSSRPKLLQHNSNLRESSNAANSPNSGAANINSNPNQTTVRSSMPNATQRPQGNSSSTLSTSQGPLTTGTAGSTTPQGQSGSTSPGTLKTGKQPVRTNMTVFGGKPNSTTMDGAASPTKENVDGMQATIQWVRPASISKSNATTPSTTRKATPSSLTLGLPRATILRTNSSRDNPSMSATISSYSPFGSSIPEVPSVPQEFSAATYSPSTITSTSNGTQNSGRSISAKRSLPNLGAGSPRSASAGVQKSPTSGSLDVGRSGKLGEATPNTRTTTANRPISSQSQNTSDTSNPSSNSPTGSPTSTYTFTRTVISTSSNLSKTSSSGVPTRSGIAITPPKTISNTATTSTTTTGQSNGITTPQMRTERSQTYAPSPSPHSKTHGEFEASPRTKSTTTRQTKTNSLSKPHKSTKGDDMTLDSIHKVAYAGAVHLVSSFVRNFSGPAELFQLGSVPGRSYKGTPLHFAAAKGHFQMVKTLLDIDKSYIDTYTEGYEHEAINLAPPDIKQKVQDFSKDSPGDYEEFMRKTSLDCGERTALHLAIEYGHLRVVECLCEGNASLVKQTRWRFDANSRNERDDRSVLHLATDNCTAQIAKILIGYGAKLEARNKDYETPVHGICRTGDIDMLRLFFDNGVRPESLFSNWSGQVIEALDQVDPIATVAVPPIDLITDVEMVGYVCQGKYQTSKGHRARIANVYAVVGALYSEAKKAHNEVKTVPDLPNQDEIVDKIKPYLIDPELEFYKSLNPECTSHKIATGGNLVLRHQGLSVVPSEVACLTNLTTLKLDSNKLHEFPSCILQISSITRISLRHNKIKALPQNLNQLSSLSKLSLHNNLISELPACFGTMTSFTHLYLSKNRLQVLPPSVGNFHNLRVLDLTYNYLSYLPEELGQLPGLTYLSVFGNCLTELPESLAYLTNIKAMVLDSNRLLSIPSSFGSLPNPEVVTIANNLAGQIFTLSEYLVDFSSGWKPCTRLKLIVLGNGGVGKTTLLNGLKKKNVSVLKKNKVSLQTRSTVGIDINVQKLKLHNKISFQVWDFAGQIEYSTTHQYFLSQSRVVYLLVVSLTRPIRPQIEYWWSYVSTKVNFKLNKSTVKFLLVGSKMDQVPEQELVGLTKQFEELLEDYNFADFQFISSLSLDGLGALQKKIIHTAKDLFNEKDSKRIPISYLDILKKLKHDAETIVTSNFNVSDAKTMRAISFLHDVGDIIFHKPSGWICIEPQILSKIMALFVCPEEHSHSLLGYINQEYQQHTSILSQEQVVHKLRVLCRSLGMELNNNSANLLVKVMEQFGFCLGLSSSEVAQYGQSGYLFPALRPAGQFRWTTFANPVFALGCRVTDAKSQVMLPQVFFRIQVSLRDSFRSKNGIHSIILYANGIQIQFQDKVAQLLLEDSFRYVDILVRGESIREFWKQIQSAVNAVKEDLPGTTFKFAYLDPSSLFREIRTFPLDLSRVSIVDEKSNVNPSYFEYGVKANIRESVRYPWDFVAGIDGGEDWQSEEGMHCKHLVLQPPPAGQSWPNPAYEQEFKAVKQAFDFFVGNDVSETFVLDKVVVLNNKSLQAKFEHIYLKFRSQKPSRSWLNDPETREWKEWIMGNLSKYVRNISGDEQTNLVLGWHGGATEEICKIIGETNFRIMGKTDAGYFGSGIYFTQYPSYGDLYAQEKIRKVALEKKLAQSPSVASTGPRNSNTQSDDKRNGNDKRKREDGGNSDVMSGQRPLPLLLSWVLLGNVYPVTENPQGNPEKSLFGKPCVPGYDSHYVLVKKVGAMNYFPCNKDTAGGPDYDEIVIFNPDQILPRYLIYYSRVEAQGDLSRTILWVDSSHTAHASLIKELQSQGFTLKLLSKTQELKDWMQHTGVKLSKQEKRQLRIISNRYRDGDGEETAGERLCQWLKDPKSLWASTPFLLFCESVSKVTFGTDVKRKIWVTSSLETVHAFATEPDLQRLTVDDE